jgi:hypothetical protein
MDISTGSWFEYLREEVLTEGLRDIGLPESVIDFIENAMAKSSKNPKMYVGNEWKKSTLNPAYRNRYVDEIWHKFMERNFKNQIQIAAGDPGHRHPIQVRTVAPYDIHGMEDGAPAQRVMYDEETVKQNKRIAFAIENIDNVLSKPLGTWRKSFVKALKALSKAGIPSEKVEIVKNELDRVTIYEFRSFWNRWDILFAWLNDEPTNYELIKGEYSLQDAQDIAQKDLNNKEDPDNIIHTFEDGYYWLDLKTDYCAIEAERMAHCGRDDRGIMVSLRKHKEERKASDSYITMSWNEEDAILYQIKGRANDVPTEDIWHTVAWFINHMGVTNVQESGEHSTNPRGFIGMNEYLEEETDAIFSGEDVVDVDQRIEAINEAIRIIDENFVDQRHPLDQYTDVGCRAEDGEEMGAEPGTVYLSMNCDWNVSIDLGWPGFELRNHEYTPTLGPDDTTQDEGYETIPQDAYRGDAEEFRSEIGLDNISYELPGEDPQVEYDVEMIDGTARLLIRIMNTETEAANDQNNASEYEYFVSNALEFDSKTEENIEKLRSKMAAGGYSVKTGYDRERAEMSAYKLDHWKVWSESGPGIEFWFKPEASADTLVPAGEVPAELMIWREDSNRNVDELYSLIFGVRNSGKDKYTSDDLNRNMARALEKQYKDMCSDATEGQQELCFGDKYAAKFVPIVLARDSRFVVEGAASYHGRGVGAYPKMPIGWRYTIGASSAASDVEIETVKSIVKYFNEHPEMVIAAAQEVISGALEGSVAQARTKKEAVMSGRLPQVAIRHIDSRYGAAAAVPGNLDADHIIRLTRWIKDNFDRMGAPEKWVAWYKYLDPLKRGSFRTYNNPIETDGDNAGKPQQWDEQVRAQMMALRTFSATVRAYSGVSQADPVGGPPGEPQPIEESVEQQIDRIERLIKGQASVLQEKDSSYDLRIYSIKLGCVIDKNFGGSESETATEIRGICSVTTVRPIAVSKRPITATSEYVLYDVKFELLGSESRIEYRDETLLPNMRRIKGLRIMTISSIHRTNRQGTIRTVRESKILREFGFGGANGGMTGQLGAAAGRRNNGSSPDMKTPRPTLQAILDDWSDGGVKIYDVPTDHGNSAHHVMMPTAELVGLMGSVYRGPKDNFDGGYQDFIANGAQGAVYVAVGQNGRIAITGNEDLVWYAKKSGLENLPVFISYQRQV